MKKFIYIVLLGVSLSSCRIYSNYERPKLDVQMEQLYRDTTNVDQALKGDTINFGNLSWPDVFSDPHLQSLIRLVLEKNADLRTADLTIQKAEAGLQVSRLAFFPSLSFSPSGTISIVEGGTTSKTYNIPLQASWQIDAFGSLRNAKKQSEYGVLAAKAARQSIQTALIASTANLYYTLEMLDAQLKTTKSTAALWDKNVEAMEVMMQAGMTNAAAVSQAKANRLSILTTIPTLESQIRKTENSLCALLHEAPHPIERGAIQDLSFPSVLSAGVPAQLLANRPDVRAAEYKLASCFYGVNKAYSAFYPNITINGTGGWTNNLGMITNPGMWVANFVGSIVQPLFARGQLRANLKIAKAEVEAAQLNFEQKLLNAGNEVSNALANYQTSLLKIQQRTKLVEELQKSVETTNFIFKHDNRVSYLETLTAQQGLLQAQLNLISDNFDRAQAVISLYQALGGGRK